MSSLVKKHSIITEFDVSLFQSGKHFRLYEKLGSHPLEYDGELGVQFSVYAPAAKKVQVIGDFNSWNGEGYELHVRFDGSGIWEGFISGIKVGDLYKYQIYSNHADQVLIKTDPFGKLQEKPSKTASVVWELDYKWKDKKWMKKREKINSLDSPYTIYEVHLGSWKKHYDGRDYTYEELADHLVNYVKEMGFTHVELMPIMEHPFEGSWGYQVTGFFAPTSRYGTPQEFMHLVDAFHKAEIGVILDWVPSHFPSDGHGLANFDGSCVYEHPDPRIGYHPDWKSMIFNYSRGEVRSFLISSALFWLEHYHIDGMRVDAVASMLYLDYSRNEGEWVPNRYGGNYNLDAINFIKDFNQAVYQHYPGVQTIAEESTSFPMVTHPVHVGGLGFGMKWMMGWMNDSIEYFKVDPFFRKHQQGKLTFNMYYAYSENFVLPFSHDEVVHGKASMIYKMPGDEWQKFANLRALYGYMYTHPGNKLLFMGSEWGQTKEWNYKEELDWGLLAHPIHEQLALLVKDLNHMFRSETAFYKCQYSHEGFDWLDFSNAEQSVLIYIRKGSEVDDIRLVVCNFTPETRDKYRFGAPIEGKWIIELNTDDKKYGGSGYVKRKTIKTSKKALHEYDQSLTINLPPMAVMILKLKEKK